MPYKCTIKQGNLLEEEDATFIVNASNTKLLFGSGVSMAFKRHCGNILQDEMHEKLRSIGKLEKGDVVATSSGNAKNFKYALHVAVMNYNKGVSTEQKAPTLQNIKTALENIEKYIKWYIENKNNQNIKLVLPLMGCGVGGLNKEDVIKLYREFFCRDVAFDCEVVIYGYNTQDYKKILKIMMEEDNGIQTRL
ncbi:macro domain-containing protein [Sulfurimonas sp.]